MPTAGERVQGCPLVRAHTGRAGSGSRVRLSAHGSAGRPGSAVSPFRTGPAVCAGNASSARGPANSSAGRGRPSRRERGCGFAGTRRSRQFGVRSRVTVSRARTGACPHRRRTWPRRHRRAVLDKSRGSDL